MTKKNEEGKAKRRRRPKIGFKPPKAQKKRQQRREKTHKKELEDAPTQPVVSSPVEETISAPPQMVQENVVVASA